MRTSRWIERFASGRRLVFEPANWWKLLVGGLLCLALVVGWPVFFYPAVWFSVFLIIEPLNMRMGRTYLLHPLIKGDCRPIISLSTGVLICGFFWEMWNYNSYPKWIYHTPGAEFLHVFEMPLLGYLGYIPFSWELFALRTILWPSGPNPRI